MQRFDGQRIAMVGARGAGMRGLAVLLAARGATILGVDRDGDSEILSEEQAVASLPSVDLVIHTDAIGAEHALLRLAATHKIPTLPYHLALGELTSGVRTLAVTGTHGKSSTTSMLAHIFISAGFNPSALVGASVLAWGGLNARVGTSDYLIVEADEYRNHYHALQVESAIITTIDFDHPDFFPSLREVVASFSHFVGQVTPTGILVVPQALPETFPTIPWPTQTKLVPPPRVPIELVLPGAHMQYNAWLAIQLAAHYGITEEESRRTLREYRGLGRRFELIGRMNAMDVVSDYGHHPREIAATLKAARERYGTGRICIIFEAHTRERLVHFFDQFKDALALADAVILVPVFVPVGREEESTDLLKMLDRLASELQKLGKDLYRVANTVELEQVLTSVKDYYRLSIAFSAGNIDAALRTFVKPK